MRLTGIRDYEPAKIKVYQKEKGIVLEEISLVAYNNHTAKFVAFGYNAKNMKSPDVEVFSALKNGQAAYFEETSALFDWLLQCVWGKNFLKKAKVAVCMAPEPTEVEVRAMLEAILACNVKQVVFSEESLSEFIHKSKNDYDIIFAIYI